jgi:hypothetical protein
MSHLEEDISVLHDSLEQSDGLGFPLGVDGNVLKTVNTLGRGGGDGTVGNETVGRIGRVDVSGSVDADSGESRTVLDDRVLLPDIRVSTESGSNDVSRVPLDGEVGSLYRIDTQKISAVVPRNVYLNSYSRSPKTMVWFSGREPLATWYSE